MINNVLLQMMYGAGAGSAPVFMPPDGTPFVTAPASTEETSPTRSYPNGVSYFGTGSGSGGQIGYSYSGAGGVFYEEWFYGTGVTLYGYKNPDGLPFQINIDNVFHSYGDNQGSTSSPVIIGQATGLTLGYHKLTVYTSGGFTESDRNDFI